MNYYYNLPQDIITLIEDMVKEEEEEDKEEDEEEEDGKYVEEEVICMRGCGNYVIKNPSNKDGVWYSCNYCLKKEDEEYDKEIKFIENLMGR
jgi:hypothetical protein